MTGLYSHTSLLLLVLVGSPGNLCICTGSTTNATHARHIIQLNDYFNQYIPAHLANPIESTLASPPQHSVIKVLETDEAKYRKRLIYFMLSDMNPIINAVVR